MLIVKKKPTIGSMSVERSASASHNTVPDLGNSTCKILLVSASLAASVMARATSRVSSKYCINRSWSEASSAGGVRAAILSRVSARRGSTSG